MNILLPIETINREIDFKLVLAGLLANKEHKIYIGQHDFLMKLVPKFKNGGIYIGKNIFHKRSEIEKGEKYKILKKYGFDVIYLHEEGGVFPGNSESWARVLKSQYNIDFFDENDAVCVWGDFQNKADVERNVNKKVNVYTTGHPRFDLCKKKWHFLQEDKMHQIKKKYDNFVLINGNYGLANHGLSLEYVFSDKGNYNVIDEQERLKRVDFFSYSSKQLISMIQLTHHLAIKFPKLNFVYRPHPSENHDYYRVIFAGVKNIFVSHDGPILPWILASEVVIHDGCTTAIEASLSGIPVINYKPNYSSEHDIWLPNQMGFKATSIDEVESGILNIINQDSSSTLLLDTKLTAVAEILYNFTGDSFNALLNVINTKMATKKVAGTYGIKKAAITKIYLVDKFKMLFYKILKPNKLKNIKYHNTKFYGLNKTESENKLYNIANVLEKKIDVKFHNPKLIEIH